MLVISCNVNRDYAWWLSRQRHLRICNRELRKVFHIPRGLTSLTMAIYTTRGKERVRVTLGTGYVETRERGVHAAFRVVPKWIWRVVRKYKGKPLYLEVTY